MQQFIASKVVMGSAKDILPHHDDSLISQFADKVVEDEQPVRKAAKETQRINTEQSLKVEIKLKNVESKEVLTAATSGATVNQKASDVKPNNSRLEAIYGGINEDLFIDARKRDKAQKVKETEMGKMANVKTDEEDDDVDQYQQKFNFEFLSDIMALLYRLGIIKHRMEKKDGKNGKR